MAVYAKVPDEMEEVDIIIAGGGTAGCVLASRLADADPSLSILIIEGGPNNTDVATLVYPALMLAQLMPTSNATIFYKGNKSKHTADRDIFVPAGGVLGGGSTINFMQYSRAQRSDYDSWNLPGWSTDELLPYLKKTETFHGPDPKGVHGHDGPIHVSAGTYTATRSQDDFISAVGKVGWPEVEDIHGLGATNGAMRALRFVSPDGKRQDVASTYLHPRLQDGKHPNLHVAVESQVERVVFNNKRAVGVVVRPNPAFHPNAGEDASRSIKARKLVVVSCGACGTPAVLERSGVGNPEVLRRAGVAVVADVPGVGHGYEDHPLLVYPYKTNLAPEETLDSLVSGRVDPGELIRNNDKRLGWNAIDVSCKLRPKDADIAALGPGFQKVWDEEFKDVPDKPLVIMASINGFPADPTGIEPGQYMGISAFTLYPLSRGHIHITGPKIDDPLDFETGFFTDPDGVDVVKARWTYKAQREIARRMQCFRGEFAAGHPPFLATSKAVCGDADGPLPEDVRDVEYSAEDDAVIDQWLRENVGTTWHSLGTVKMGPRDANGAVDASLSVYGVEGLKVVDLSIASRNVGANTNSTALVIGEKAADMIIRELGLGA